MTEGFDSVDDGEEFTFMDGVVFLCWVELAGLVANRLVTFALVLEKDCTNSNIRSVRVEGEGGIRTGEGDDEQGSRDQGCFEGFKGVNGILREDGGKGDGGACEVGQGSSNSGEVFDESAEETNESEERSCGGDVMGSRPSGNGGDFLRIHRNALRGHSEAQESGGGLSKGAFGEATFEIGGVECCEDFGDMFNVFFFGLGVNQAVINESHHKLIQVWLQNIVDEPHEGTGCIGQAHW